MDDERIHAPTETEAYRASRQVASRESYLGIQDAARKRRPPSQQGGAWAGSIVHTNNLEVGLLISNERWMKTKTIISKWFDLVCELETQLLDTKSLVSDRGFLVYVARTYQVFTPYLKGIHLTIDGWRANRDKEGWRMIELQEIDQVNSPLNPTNHVPFNSHDYPDSLKPVPRLKDDLAALKSLTESSDPPVLLIHTKKIFIARYLFGDASASGFGVTSSEDQKLSVEFGTWTEIGSESSSNYREFANFVLKLEREAEKGNLDGAELFLFTDNATTESAFHNGTSSSKTLFDLILRVRLVQLNHSTRIHFIHIAGTRMIKQGTDGLSRGNMSEGVLVDHNMLSYVPIHMPANLRSPQLINWIRFWTKDSELVPMAPNEWIWRGQGISLTPFVNVDNVELPCDSDERVFLWCPPPCIADVALELMRKSIHKRPRNFHIFVVPKIMTYKWRRHALNNCDMSFYIDVGFKYWQLHQHESLLICLFLPMLHCAPWSYRGTTRILAMERKLRKVLQAKDGSESTLLRKFWQFFWRVPTLPNGVVRELLSSEQV